MTLKKTIEISENYYRIADLIVKIDYPDTLNLDNVLPTFRVFQVDSTHKNPAISILLSTDKAPTTTDMGILRSDESIAWDDRFSFYEKEDAFITTIVNEKGNELWYMRSERDFSQSTIYIPSSSTEGECSAVIWWMLMMVFGQAALLHNTIMIHASVINCNGQGIAFLGKSGTGKSTHSRLWLNHIPNTSLLNDDNPAVRMSEDGIHIYGTPWSGKTPCYKNEKINLKAFVRLQQAPSNVFKFQAGVHSFIAVLPSCTAIRWNKELFATMNSTLEKVVAQVPVGLLKCLPDEEAAQLCYNRIFDKPE